MRARCRCMFCPRVVAVPADALSPRLVVCERCASDTKKDRYETVRATRKWQKAMTRANEASKRRAA